MIGYLPKSLVVKDKEIDIRTDYRIALNIFEAEGRQLETFNKYEIKVPNNSANGLSGAKIKSAKMA